MIAVSDVQFRNALLPIRLSSGGRILFVRAVQPSNVYGSTCLMPDGIVISVSEEQPLNAECSIEVSRLDNTKVVSLVQPKKAAFFIGVI